MNREALISVNEESKGKYLSAKGKDFLSLDLSKNVSGTYEISNDTAKDILIENLNFEKANVTFRMEKNSKTRMSLLSSGHFTNLNIDIYLYSGAELDAYFADFVTDSSCTVSVNVYLEEEGTTLHWHLASLATGNDKRVFDISAYHNSPKTYAVVDNYGVCIGDSSLLFKGVSEIKNGSVKSSTFQNAKIMVFDSRSHGTARPILKIDENDIQASHAAVVGKINDDHLFYLTSRGLTEEKAKELITFGYLKPILSGFDDGMKETITELIEGNMTHVQRR